MFTRHIQRQEGREASRAQCRHNYHLLGADTRLQTKFASVGKAGVKEIRSSQENEGGLVMKTQSQMWFDCTFTISWHQYRKKKRGIRQKAVLQIEGLNCLRMDFLAWSLNYTRLFPLCFKKHTYFLVPYLKNVPSNFESQTQHAWKRNTLSALKCNKTWHWILKIIRRLIAPSNPYDAQNPLMDLLLSLD